MAELAARLADLRTTLDGLRSAHGSAARALDARREAVQAADRRHQEAVFELRVGTQKIVDLEASLRELGEKTERIDSAAQALSHELAALDEGPVQADLDRSLACRVEREKILAQARGALEDAERVLKESEQQRLACEQNLLH